MFVDRDARPLTVDGQSCFGSTEGEAAAWRLFRLSFSSSEHECKDALLILQTGLDEFFYSVLLLSPLHLDRVRTPAIRGCKIQASIELAATLKVLSIHKVPYLPYSVPTRYGAQLPLAKVRYRPFSKQIG